MSITDELRKYARGYELTVNHKLLEIADHIDAEHQKACDYEWNNGYEADYLGIESWLTEHPQVMEKHGWIRLPMDADGVPICVGDKVTEHEDGHTFNVDGFMDWNGEWWVFMRDGVQAPAIMCTHYNEPTVEDVLADMVDKASSIAHAHAENDMGGEEMMDALQGLVAEFAAKLRLVGEGE